jgi:protein SCO1/2
MKLSMNRRFQLTAGACAVLAFTAACGGGGSSSLTAAQLSAPLAVPAGSFTDTANQQYDLASASKGLLTLVYFGYTNCPDVCPTTMADIGNALRSLPADVSKNVQVVFVTSDPARDTPAAMKTWLSNFDTGLSRPFIGLTSTIPAIDAYAAKLGVTLEPPEKQKDGTIEVTHAAQVIAFSPKTNTADYVWLPGTKVSQYASDIKALESGKVT